MSGQFVAEIRIFPFNFAPRGWAFCDGQLLPISQYTAVFSLLGTNYGGDGKSTFGLPNFQGNVPLHWGQSTSGTQYFVGQEGGSQDVTLLQSEMPGHTHAFNATASAANTLDPTSNVLGIPNYTSGSTRGTAQAYSTTAPAAMMNAQALNMSGGGLPHSNLMPYLTLNFCIALQGIFPPRP